MKTQDKGFTIIELVIVIAIMGLLSAIAIAMYNEYRVRTAKSVVIADTKNCLNACLAKISDSNVLACSATDCSLSAYTASCTPDLSGPVYVMCVGKEIVAGYTCSIYQNGQVSCS